MINQWFKFLRVNKSKFLRINKFIRAFSTTLIAGRFHSRVAKG